MMSLVRRCGESQFSLQRCGPSDYRRVPCMPVTAAGVALRLPYWKGVTTLCEATECPPNGTISVGFETGTIIFARIGLRPSCVTYAQLYESILGQQVIVNVPGGQYLYTWPEAITHMRIIERWEGSERWLWFVADAYLCIANVNRDRLRSYQMTAMECCGAPNPYPPPPCLPKGWGYRNCTNMSLLAYKPPFGLTYTGSEPWDYGSVIGQGLMDFARVTYRLKVRTDTPIGIVATYRWRAFALWVNAQPEVRAEWEFPPVQVHWEGTRFECDAYNTFYLTIESLPTTQRIVGKTDVWLDFSCEYSSTVFGKTSNNCCSNVGENGIVHMGLLQDFCQAARLVELPWL